MPFINCPRCGKTISNRAAQCPNCGFQFGPYRSEFSKDALQGRYTHHCPECNSVNISFQTVNEPIKTNWLMILGYVLLALTCCGFLVLIPIILQQKNRIVTYATCRDCGCHWNTADRNLSTNKKNILSTEKKKEQLLIGALSITISLIIIFVCILIYNDHT